MENDEKPPTETPADPQPQAAGGSPSGTIPKLAIPIEIFNQQIPVPTPQAGEDIRAALEAHEEDACVRDRKSGGWVYVRTRAFVDLKKAQEQAAEKAKEEKKDGESPQVPTGGVVDDGKQPDPPTEG